MIRSWQAVVPLEHPDGKAHLRIEHRLDRLVPGKLGLKFAEIMRGQTGLLTCAKEIVYQMVNSVLHSAYQCHHCASSLFVLFSAMGQNNAPMLNVGSFRQPGLKDPAADLKRQHVPR